MAFVRRGRRRFGYLTGWRRGEIVSLTWTDVDHDGGAIRLRPEHSKNGRGRIVPFDVLPQLAALMERRLRARLFTDHDGRPRVADYVLHHDGEPMGDFRKAWASACIAAGLYHMEQDSDGTERKIHEKLFHDLRRTAVRNMVRAGVDPAVAMKISGHRTRSIFDRYNIVDEADLRLGMQKVGRYVDTLPTTRQEASVRTERGENAESRAF